MIPSSPRVSSPVYDMALTSSSALSVTTTPPPPSHRLASPMCDAALVCPGAPRLGHTRRFRSPLSTRSSRRPPAQPYCSSPSPRERTPRSPRKLRRSPALTALAVFTSLAFSEADSPCLEPSEVDQSTASSCHALGEALKVEGEGSRRMSPLLNSPRFFDDFESSMDGTRSWLQTESEESGVMLSSDPIMGMMESVESHPIMSSRHGLGLGIDLTGGVDLEGVYRSTSTRHPSSHLEVEECESDFSWQDPPPPYNAF